MQREVLESRDESVDVAKGIGILFVIGGHCGYSLIPGIQAYSFHIPLFYFIAGFFLRKNERAGLFVKKKAYALLLPYFVYNIFFGIVTYFLRRIGISWRGSPFETLDFHNFFIEPFLSGHQYSISCALWFVPSLFLVMMLYLFTQKIIFYFYKNKFKKIIFCILLLCIYYINIYGYTYDENIYIAAVSRTLIGYCFCMMGSVFYSFYNKINIFILLFVSIFIYGYLSVNFGVYGYSYVWNDYTSGYGKIISFPLSLSGILMVISISKIIVLKNEFINKNGFIWIGKNSFHVMALHLSGFLLLNMLLTGLNPVRQMSDVDNIYYRYANIDWIYFFFSTVFCIVTIKTIQKFSGKFFFLGRKNDYSGS